MSTTTPRTGEKLVRLNIPRPGGVAGPGDPAPAPAAVSSADITAAIERVNTAFEAFKAENDRRLAQIENRGSDDVVTRETVDRINAEITDANKAFRALQAQLAAGALSGGGQSADDAASKRYLAGFRDYVRGAISKEAMAAIASPRADMSTLSNPDGGFLVPEEVETAIGRVQATMSVMRQLADVSSISAAAWVKNHNLGGAGGGWVGEKSARPKTSTPELSEIKIVPGEMYASPAVSQSLLDDARVSIADMLGTEIGIVFSELEGAAFYNGNGVERPRGVIAYPNVANASWAWGKVGYFATGVAAALSDASNNGVDALLNMVYGLKSGYRTNAGWIMNDLSLADVRKLKDENGAYLWQPSTAAGEPGTLLGYRADTDDNWADIGAGAFPITFGDMRRAYKIVDRIGIRVLPDPYTAKPNVLIYTTKRVGGGIQDFEALKHLKVAAS